MSNQKKTGNGARGYSTFWHYTSEEGARGIKQTGRIEPSHTGQGDAAFGDGVYATAMNPREYSKSEIAKNNYDDSPSFWQAQQASGKTDYAVKVRVPNHQVERCAELQGRDVVKIGHGNTVKLSKGSKIQKVPDY